MSRHEPVAANWLCNVSLFRDTPGGLTVFVQGVTAPEAALQALAQVMKAYRATDASSSVVVVTTPWLDGRRVTRKFTVVAGELMEDVEARKDEAA
jgi:hypothetical protein